MKSQSAMVEETEHARRLRQIAHIDGLTGLPNRRLLGDRVQKAMAQSKRWGQQMAVARLNLDGLEAIYDRHGHAVGDQVLVLLARGMRRTLGKGDTLAHLEGNGFAVVLPGLDETEQSRPALTRLLEAAAEPVRVGELTLQVSASIGVSFYPQEEDTDADQLLRQAGQARHVARAAGKNRYHFFDRTEDSLTSGNPETLDRIRQALATGEFLMHYQPKVNMNSGAVIGVEALIRWRHPERGLMAPGDFLPIIDDHPLAGRVGEWGLETVLTQMDKWLEAGLAMPVSVNVGVGQLQQPGFFEHLGELLTEHPRITPSNLELEIVEGRTLEDAVHLTQLLTKGREMGLSFALDDFGSGHLSLNDLKGLPVDVLKIDPCFVREILESPEDLTILEAVLGIVAAYRRHAVAKGVETVEQGVMLLRLGCELAQGHGIAQPMEAEALPGWAAAWRPDPRWGEACSVSLDDRPLLRAGVEHRAWAAAIEAFLRGESTFEPRLSRHQCQFGAWLYAEGPAGRSSLPAFQAIVAAHWRIHALAAGIVKFHTQGRTAEGLARLGELKDLVDKLADLLNDFGQQK